MLKVLATFHPGAMTRPQIARGAGLRVSSGTFSTYWSDLRKDGLLEETEGGLYRVTDRGLEVLGAERPQVPKTFAERRAFWEARLRAGERRMLAAVIDAAAMGITRAELAAVVQMSATSGTFSTYLSTLHNNRLTAHSSDRVVVHPWLLKGPTAAV